MTQKVTKKSLCSNAFKPFSYLCVSNQEDMKKRKSSDIRPQCRGIRNRSCRVLQVSGTDGNHEAFRLRRYILKDTSLLYLKASMLPKCETIGDEALETFVTEETYEILRMNLAGILAEKDDYLDVFVSDMKLQRPAHHQKTFPRTWPTSIRTSETLFSYSSWDSTRR